MSELKQAWQAFEQGSYAQAQSLAELFLARCPEDPRALQILGLCALQLGQFQAATLHFKQLCQFEPEQETHALNLSKAYQALEQPEAALQVLQTLLEKQPHCAEAYFLVADIQRQGRHFQKALQALQKAHALTPQNAQYTLFLANIYFEINAFEAAIQCYTLTLGLNPQEARAHYNLGQLYQERQQPLLALQHYQQALQLVPTMPGLRRHLASVCEALGLLRDARQVLLQRQQSEPQNQALAWHRQSLMPLLALSGTEIQAQRQALAADLQHFRAQGFAISGPEIEEQVQPPSALLFQGLPNRALLSAYAELFENSFVTLKDQIQQAWQQAVRPDSRKHLGFVVTRRHEGIFVKYMQALFKALPKASYRVTVVAESQAWQRIMAPCLQGLEIQHLPLPASFDAVALSIAAQGFDLLYHWEVGSDALNYFLPYLALAPLQVTSLGWPQTTGIPQMDYYLSSALVEPEDGQEHYSESLYLMPGLPLSCSEPVLPDRPLDLTSLGFQPEHHHYVCAQNPRKLHPDFDAVLAEILRRDPRGQVWLRVHASPFVTERIQMRLEMSLPDVVHRIHWLPFLPSAAYLSLLQQAPVLLDTLHISGANSSLDAFAVGTPVVTLPGETARGRFTQACYQRMGIQGPVAQDAAQYVDLAVSLGTDKAAQQALREQIRTHKHKLFQGDAVQGHLKFFEAVLS